MELSAYKSVNGPSLGQVRVPPDGQVLELSNSDSFKAHEYGSVEARTVIGDLYYKLTGLLCLQTLFTTILKENSQLKAQVDRLGSHSSTASATTTESTSTPFSATYEAADYRNGDSLLFATFRSMQVYITRLEQMVHNTEGTSAQGLIQACLPSKSISGSEASCILSPFSKIVNYERPMIIR